jgi:uncharacterized delta-60 repeat protein
VNRTILGPLVAFAIVLTACSGDDDDADDTTAPTEAAATTSAADDPPATPSPTTDPPSTAAPTTEAQTETTAAASGSGLDATFGTDGILVSPQSETDNDRAISVAHGADGLIYTAGFTSIGEDHMFAVSRYTDDGAPDPSFGDGGTAVINITEGGGGAEVARGLVVQDDGMVLVAGPFEKDPTAEGDAADDLDVAVIRLDATGTPDPAFGENGIAKIDLGPGKTIDAETYITDNAWGLTARDGGYALFAVTPNQEADRTDTDYAIVGLTETGALDAAFGTNGVVVADLDASGDNARTIGTAADGSILATGYSRDGDGVVSPTLIKMSAAGVLDEAFGTGGIANHIVLPGVAESYQWVAQGDNYVLAGYGRGADSEEKVDLIAYRFLADGSWDETFGTDGVTRVDLAGEDDRARNMTMLPDGNILVVGSGKLDADNIDAMVVMLDPDGAPVESFGDGGHLLVDLGGPADGFFGVSLAADESSVLMAGFKGADPEGDENDDAVLARLAL